MTTPSSTTDVATIARELMEARMQSVLDLEAAGNARAAAEQAFAEADAEYTQRFTAAVKNGWTEGELARMKLAKPGARVRKRAASRAGASRGSDGTSNEGGAEPQGDGAPQDYS